MAATTATPPLPQEETTLHLLNECLKITTIKELAAKLNLCIGTIKRWIELNDVPLQYTFDLHKILSRDIDYGQYSASQKDQFFTPASLAQKCWDIFRREIANAPIAEYTFIEPSAGDGSFLKILPEGSIGLDIEPRFSGIHKQDYLSWSPPAGAGAGLSGANPWDSFARGFGRGAGEA